MFLYGKKDLTHDDLRDMFNGTKPVLKQSEVRHVAVPWLDELSTANTWPLFVNDKLVMSYMPSHSTAERLPPRQYWWSVLNTFYPQYVHDAIRKALDIRHKNDADNNEADTILITDEWYDELMNLPFRSQKKGTMVHLLKQGAKRVPTSRKRIKHTVLLPKDHPQTTQNKGIKKI